MDGGAGQGKQQPGRAGGDGDKACVKVKAKSKVEPYKPAFLPFTKALQYARSLKLKRQKEWTEWCKIGKRPANIPTNPGQVYKHDGWQGYGHWLGTGNQVGGKLDVLPFKKALLYARSLKLKSNKEWRDWSKIGERPVNIPCCPEKVYKHDGWQGYGHWLGTGNQVGGKLEFLPFKEALLYARSLKLTTKNKWGEWCKRGKRPVVVPSNPQIIYKNDGWQGYGHWLGTGNVGVK